MPRKRETYHKKAISCWDRVSVVSSLKVTLNTMHLCKVLEPYITMTPIRIPRPRIYTNIDMAVLAKVDEVISVCTVKCKFTGTLICLSTRVTETVESCREFLHTFSKLHCIFK